MFTYSGDLYFRGRVGWRLIECEYIRYQSARVYSSYKIVWSHGATLAIHVANLDLLQHKTSLQRLKYIISTLQLFGKLFYVFLQYLYQAKNLFIICIVMRWKGSATEIHKFSSFILIQTLFSYIYTPMMYTLKST